MLPSFFLTGTSGFAHSAFRFAITDQFLQLCLNCIHTTRYLSGWLIHRDSTFTQGYSITYTFLTKTRFSTKVIIQLVQHIFEFSIIIANAFVTTEYSFILESIIFISMPCSSATKIAFTDNTLFKHLQVVDVS